MAKVTKVELHLDAFVQLRNSPPMLADLGARANRIAGAAGEGMEVTVSRGAARGRSSVHTATRQARINEAQNMALTRAIDAGR